ncbi:Uncharacterised protein [Mycobacteroides abscessus subsp. massiliense]|nr:Uncharacterised protein [Mycobacteroides abscessus subsp. massiliense]
MPVVEGRRTSAHTAHHMVMVPDWGIAVRRPAGLIAQIDQLGQSPGEQSASRLGLDQCTGGAAPVQPPHENFSLGTDGFRDEPARDGGRDWPVAGDGGRLVASAQQRLIRDGDVHPDRNRGGS